MQPDWAKGLLKRAAQLFSIPIIGIANCGPATIFAEENFHGFKRLIHDSANNQIVLIAKLVCEFHRYFLNEIGDDSNVFVFCSEAS